MYAIKSKLCTVYDCCLLIFPLGSSLWYLNSTRGFQYIVTGFLWFGLVLDGLAQAVLVFTAVFFFACFLLPSVLATLWYGSSSCWLAGFPANSLCFEAWSLYFLCMHISYTIWILVKVVSGFAGSQRDRGRFIDWFGLQIWIFKSETLFGYCTWGTFYSGVIFPLGYLLF